MKRSSLIYGFDPYALRTAGRQYPPVDVTLQDLGRLGIPARKAQMLDFNRKAIQIGQEQ